MTREQMIKLGAEAIVRCDSDYSHGKPGQLDFVREVSDATGLAVGSDHADLHEQVADELFEDAGVNMPDERSMAAFIIHRLEGHPHGASVRYALRGES